MTPSEAHTLPIEVRQGVAARKAASPKRAASREKLDNLAQPAKTPVLVKLADLSRIPPYQTLLPIDGDTLAAIQEAMRIEGADPSQPIHVWPVGDKYILVDGYTRVTAAQAIGIEELPAFLHDFKTEGEALDFAIRCQLHRRNIKDGEFLALVKIYDEKIKPGSQQDRIAGKFAPKASGDANGKSASITAEALNTSATKVERARRVIENANAAILKMITDGKLTINAAVNEIVRQEKNAKKASKVREAPPDEFFPLAPLTDSEIAFAAWNVIERVEAATADAAKFRIAADKRDIAFKAKTMKKIVKEFGHRRILVSPNEDLLSEEVPSSVIREVLTSAGNTKDCEFLFSTRHPSRLSEFTWEDNMFAGVSIFEQREVTDAEAALMELNARRKWIFVEQLTMELKFNHLDSVDWVVVRTRSSIAKAEPTPDNLQRLLQRAWEVGCPVFFDQGISYRAVDPPRPPTPVKASVETEGGAQ